MKKGLPGQMDLFAPAAPVAAKPVSYRDALVRQIVRDHQTLDDPDFLDQECPGAQFYEDRIVAYMVAVRELDARGES